jgi:DNA-directed RNA polymerase subunit RPC12/RpoP
VVAMNKIKGVFIGRYGTDQLNMALLLASLLLATITALANSVELIIICFVPLFFYLYRAFSRQHILRYNENVAYMKLLRPIIRPLYIKTGRIKDKHHKYYRCPNCEQTISVEKQKGKAMISCPTCKTQFMK